MCSNYWHTTKWKHYHTKTTTPLVCLSWLLLLILLHNSITNFVVVHNKSKSLPKGLSLSVAFYKDQAVEEINNACMNVVLILCAHCDPPIRDTCEEKRPSRASRTVREDVGASPLPGNGSSSFSESSSRSLEVEERDWSRGSRSLSVRESFLLSWKNSGWPATAAFCWCSVSPTSICPSEIAMASHYSCAAFVHSCNARWQHMCRGWVELAVYGHHPVMSGGECRING